jgi:hypothetical protein
MTREHVNENPGSSLRSPADGSPYYCVHCKKGYDDYLKCEDLDCELETDADAQARG